MTDKTNEALDKLLKLVEGMQDLKKNLFKEPEQPSDEELADDCQLASFEFSQAICEHMRENPAVNMMALCDLASGYGVYRELDKTDIMETFEKMLDINIKRIEKNRDKIEKIKNILRRE